MKTLRETIVEVEEELDDKACEMNYAVVLVGEVNIVYSMFRSKRDATNYVATIQKNYGDKPCPFEVRKILK